MQGERLTEQIAYWRNHLAGAPALLELPTDRPRAANRSSRGGVLPIKLPAKLSKQLEQLSEQHGATLFMTLLTAWATLLSRYSRQTNVVVGTPIANRNRVEIEPLIGFFVNTLALHIDLNNNPSFEALLQQVRQTTLDAAAYQDVPFEKLVEELDVDRDLTHSPLIQVMFIWQNTPRGEIELPNLTLAPLPGTFGQTAKFDLSVQLEQTPDGVMGHWTYSDDLFNRATIERMNTHLGMMLQAIVEQPTLPVQQLPLLTEREQHQLMFDWNDIPVPYVADQTIVQMVEARVDQSPDALALVCEGERLTYRDFNQRANQLARHLVALGVTADVPVALFLERTADSVVSILAILKAGGCFVPLNPQDPPTRIANTLSVARPPIILAQTSTVASLPSTSAQICLIDTFDGQPYPDKNLDLSIGLKTLAYILFTSGSTGTPKGVTVAHQQFSYYIHGIMHGLEIPQEVGITYAQLQSYAFDGSIGFMFPFFTFGGCVHLLSEEKRIDPAAVTQYFLENRIDCFKATPSHLALLLDRDNPTPPVPKLRLIAGGEPLTRHFAQKLRRMVPDGCRIFNQYGPTEATIIISTFEVGSELPTAILPIGKPLPGTQLYVLDDNLRPAPIGVPGQLFIGGLQVASGYLNQPEMTRERFIQNPFNKLGPGSVGAERLYMTGDLCRFLPDGNIEFLGRIDHQVKIRGIRVELGEIESVLEQHPTVGKAVVDVQGEQQRLIAYIVAEPLAEQASPAALHAFLVDRLPDYMIPAAFVPLDKLPLSPNGKLDKRKLPAANEGAYAASNSYIPPRNLFEAQLVDIWSACLNVANVGVDDNFFALGGHSLLAVQVMTQIQTALGVQLPLATLFQHPTIAQLAQQCEQVDAATSWSPLVPIRPSGSRPPLFCIHPVGGNVLSFYHFAQLQDEDQPVYGLQSIGLDGQTAPLTTIEAMANCYIEQIRTIQPQGPYHLVGYSSGGLIAYEMVCQLQRVDEGIAQLLIIDAEPKTAVSTDVESRDEIEWWLALATLGYQRLGLSLPFERALLEQMPEDERLTYLLQTLQADNVLPQGTVREIALGMLNVYTANSLANAHYVMDARAERSIPLTVVSVNVAGDLWRDFASELVVISAEGTHETVLQYPHIEDWVQQLKPLQKNKQ